MTTPCALAPAKPEEIPHTTHKTCDQTLSIHDLICASEATRAACRRASARPAPRRYPTIPWFEALCEAHGAQSCTSVGKRFIAL